MMDWAEAAELNRAILLRIVAELFTMARIVPGERPELDPLATTLPRYVYRMAMFILEPAEAAVRRLLIIAAQGYRLALKAQPRRGVSFEIVAGQGGASPLPAFKMFDPIKRFEDYWKQEMEGYESRPFPKELPEPQRFAPVNAVSLWHRINALHGALTNMKASARRYARWKARRDYALKNNLPLRPNRSSLMRPGRAPGWRRKPTHAIHGVLHECHNLALDILSPAKQRWG